MKGITQLLPFRHTLCFSVFLSRVLTVAAPRQPAAPRPVHTRASPRSVGGPRGPHAHWVCSICVPGRQCCSDASTRCPLWPSPCLTLGDASMLHGLSHVSPPSFTRSSRPPAKFRHSPASAPASHSRIRISSRLTRALQGLQTGSSFYFHVPQIHPHADTGFVMIHVKSGIPATPCL